MPETPPPFEEILAYLRRYGSTYSRDSLEQQLRQGGADLATIDRAFLAWEDEILAADQAAALPAAPPPRRPVAWPWSLALAAVSVLIPVLLVGAGTALFKAPLRPDVGLVPLARGLAFGLWLGELGLGLVLVRLKPRLARVLLLAALWQLCLVIAAVLLVAGFCVWLFVQMAHGGHG